MRDIETFATPRRLALIARDLPAATDPVREETKGPRASAPPQALEGFLRKTGLTREALVERDGVLFAVVERPGRPAAEVLAEVVPAVVRAFPWPKSMRWGEGLLRWVRPLHGIVALLGEEIVPFEVDGIAAGAATVGHRFHHPGPITIGSAADYGAKLRACHVVVDPAERRGIIEGAARALAEARGLRVVPDAGLVAENAGLTEWPVPLLGDFDPAFLEVPREVIQLTMRTNQRYFACVDADRTLAPAFVCTANIEARDGGAAIVAGNRKVLAARLSDARFFWEQDRKVPLEEQAAKLGTIVFHDKLGTVADKVERVAQLARWLVEEGIVRSSAQSGEDRAQLAELADQAARLSKADLVTGMVGEFPELQGVMGGYYARAQGLPQPVAEAIRDHYKPVGQGDEVPTAPVTVAVSLADKLDTIFSFFSVDEKPTGSRDPFALRRAALGVIAILLANGVRLPLGTVARDNPLATRDVIDFFADRLKVQQREAGVRHDLIDAVFALGGEDDLVRLLARVKALQAFVASEDGANLLAGYKRAANILRKEGWEGVPGRMDAPGYAPEPAEGALLAALDVASTAAHAGVVAEDYETAMQALAGLRSPIDAFFEHVTVNDANPARRAARLAMLARMRDAVHQVADFSRIEG